MYAAWNTWRDWAEEMRRQQYALAGALRRMINRKLSQALSSGSMRQQWPRNKLASLEELSTA